MGKDWYKHFRQKYLEIRTQYILYIYIYIYIYICLHNITVFQNKYKKRNSKEIRKYFELYKNKNRISNYGVDKIKPKVSRKKRKKDQTEIVKIKPRSCSLSR